MAKMHNRATPPAHEPENGPEIVLDPDRFDVVTAEEGRELLERQAREYLNMSGEEFARRYHAHDLEDYDHSAVIHVSYALSLAEGPAQEPENDPEIGLDPDRFDVVSMEEGRELLERQSRKYLNMSGEEFARRYHGHDLEDYDHSAVIRVSYALSFAEGPKHGPAEHSR